jgi:hypothetical protein
MAADSNSKIAWHRVQLKKNRAALKQLEVARFTVGHDKLGGAQKAIDELSRKIAESEKCISAYAAEAAPARHGFPQPDQCQLRQLERPHQRPALARQHRRLSPLILVSALFSAPLEG